MSYIGCHPVVPLPRLQEKEELRRLNERFSTYVQHVRHLGQQVNNVDTSAFLRATKILEDEIVDLKNIYESELEKLRREIDASAHQRTTLHIQNNKQQKFTGELQDRLTIETDKTKRLMDEMNVLQRKITNLEAEIQDARLASQRPQETLNQLQRSVGDLTREIDQCKHGYEQAQVAKQEAEDKVQQIIAKLQFSEQVHRQQAGDYQARLHVASATILSLEARVRDLSTADVSVGEMLKQVRDTAETELRKYQVESEEQYNRNLTALKAQIDSESDALHKYTQEKSELVGSIGELQAKIRNLEGQVANLQHQKKTLEDAVSVERNRAADNIQQLEKKLREVQDMLVVKMREVTNAREANIPLRAEIEALKVLLEEEERRLRVPLGIVSASVVQTSMPEMPTTNQIMTTSSLDALKTANWIPPRQQTFGISGQLQSLADSRKAGLLQNSTISSPRRTQGLAPLPLYSVTSMTSPRAPLAMTLAADTTSASANYNYNSAYVSGLSNSLYPYNPSPPLDTFYIPEALHMTEEGSLAYDGGVSDYDLYMHGLTLPMTGPRYHYETTPSLNYLHVDPATLLTPQAVGPVQGRAKSATTKCVGTWEAEVKEAGKTCQDRSENEARASLGRGRDYFHELFHNFEKDTLFSKSLPKSSPVDGKMPSTYHEYPACTFSAIGDLKILEVDRDGKYVRLVNDGSSEMEIGGYMIQQNIGGRPVAVFRFPPHVKFSSDTTITIWSATNDLQLNNPPRDFIWKEQQKWGGGPEYTTILCRPNGQAVAWATASHRFRKDAYAEASKPKEDKKELNKYEKDSDSDEENGSVTESNIDTSGIKSESVYLKREKQQPPSLIASKHPHGTTPANNIHPHIGQQRPLCYGNDDSTYSRQSRTQTTRPDPIPGLPYSGVPAQRINSAPVRRIGSKQGSRSSSLKGVGMLGNKSAGSIRMACAGSPFLSPLQKQLTDVSRDQASSLMDTVGETCEGPSPFMKPHRHFAVGLEQVRSQCHMDFMPPMPHPPQLSC